MNSRVAANDPKSDQLIESLMTDSWKISPQGLSDAKNTLRDNKDLFQKNTKLKYALALTMLRHHEYETAAQYFQDIRKQTPMDLPAWRGEIWVHLLKKEYDAALLALPKMFKAIPPTELMPDKEELILTEVRFLGKLFAFLEGPVASDVSQPIIKKQKAALTKRLVGQRGSEFETNYKEVIDLFNATSGESKQAKVKAKQDEELAKLKKQEQIALQKKQNELEQQQAEEQLSKLKSDWFALQEQFDKKEAPLTTQITRLEANLSVIRREILSLTDAIQFTLERLEDDPPPRERDRLRRELARLDLLLSNYERDQQVVLAEGRRLTSERANLRNQRLAAQRSYQRSIETINDQKNTLARLANRIKLEESRALRPATGNTAKVRVISAQAKSLRNYADFPLELERHELLSNLP